MATNTLTTGAPAKTRGGTTLGWPPLMRAKTMPSAPNAPSTPAPKVKAIPVAENADAARAARERAKLREGGSGSNDGESGADKG